MCWNRLILPRYVKPLHYNVLCLGRILRNSIKTENIYWTLRDVRSLKDTLSCLIKEKYFPQGWCFNFSLTWTFSSSWSHVLIKLGVQKIISVYYFHKVYSVPDFNYLLGLATVVWTVNFSAMACFFLITGSTLLKLSARLPVSSTFSSYVQYAVLNLRPLFLISGTFMWS